MRSAWLPSSASTNASPKRCATAISRRLARRCGHIWPAPRVPWVWPPTRPLTVRRIGRMGTSREQRRVVVVGGGLAGLAATVWLAELGYAVTLVESNGSLGGRTIGLTSDHGDAIENGQHVLAGSYDCIF